MIDFLMISTKFDEKKNQVDIYPKFLIKKSSDLMIRGGDFYAIWDEENGLWSTDEQIALDLIDKELDNAEKRLKAADSSKRYIIHYMWDADSGMIDKWHKYCQRQTRDSFHILDTKLIFSNMETKKEDYASKRLPYPLEEGPCPAYEHLISTLYSPEERHKIEWAIGSIVAGESVNLQKFLVLYGSAGTGKSTILNIIQQLFEGYYSVFDAKALGSSSNSFALEAFRTNPLVAIQHDGDLSKIEDNTRLNSLVSHELMTVNEKFKSTYENRFVSFLFMGTNKPVKITDSRSGLLRRLIDVSPSGEKLSPSDYHRTVKQIKFELGAIAYHCMKVFEDDPEYYNDYIPINMMGASNDFYNYMLDSYFLFKNEDGVSLKTAWESYKQFCEDAKVQYAFTMRVFKEELKNYFREFEDRYTLPDGTRIRNYFKGFRLERFGEEEAEEEKEEKTWSYTINFDSTTSAFDEYCADCPAQYATDAGIPGKKWSTVTTKLSDLDTSKLHYVKIPENHIVIDFDIPNENGEKDFQKNLEEASKWPATYAEVSKSGKGIHLHYIYSGDVSKLNRVYSDHIEIKVFVGDSSLRRMLTKCNSLPIATISSGLPLRKEKRMVNFEGIKSEKQLRNMVRNNLEKKYFPNTKPSVDFIYKILNDAYESGMSYDLTDMRNAVLSFAAGSTNQSDYCIKLVNKMKFKSLEASKPVESECEDIVFFDIEVFPNLFLVNWKFRGKENPVIRMINPSPAEIEALLKYRLVGFNCRRYDNHILYARLIGKSIEELYEVSQKIINKSPNAFFGEAYNLSYTDVYDFSSKKQSLKKFEVELGIHHKELGLPWDQPVPQEKWEEVAAYCDNDVLATEAVFEARYADFLAREILADVAGMTVNDTTNSLTTKIIFGNDRNPQKQFNYRDMGDISKISDRFVIDKDMVLYTNLGDEFTVFDDHGRPIFPGYKYDRGISTYRDEEVGEGGYVYAEPGMYGNVALLDIASMHPSSVVAEELFGPVYTKRFEDILNARIAIKHKDFDSAKKMLNGALAKYLNDESVADNLAQALKIAINSVYGLTSAGFSNAFRDPRNKDNIVAKRGALFMINLKHEVQKRGFTVAHIKTDSIKIPDATPDIIQFVMDYGKMYGYNFEHEGTYDRICLVNNAVYIAKFATVEQCEKLYGADYVHKAKDILKDNKKHGGEWTATGTQFQVPYVFKKLFTKEPIQFSDTCEVKSVTSAIYLDMNEKLPNVAAEEAELDKLLKKDPENPRIDILRDEIASGHNYIFIGKVGQFCPVRSGVGGGVLVRDQNGKMNAVVGTTGYRWMESEVVRELHKENDIDYSYYDELVNDAVEEISKYGDFGWFVSDDPYVSPWFKADDGNESPYDTDYDIFNKR